MKTIWHLGSGLTIAALAAATVILASVLWQQERQQTKLLDQIREMEETVYESQEQIKELDFIYRLDIQSTAARLARCQKQIKHATYLTKGIEQLDPQPFAGYPVCQMGCCLSRDSSIAGIDVCAEETFIAAYNAEILGVSETTGPNQASHAIGAGAPQHER